MERYLLVIPEKVDPDMVNQRLTEWRKTTEEIQEITETTTSSSEETSITTNSSVVTGPQQQQAHKQVKSSNFLTQKILRSASGRVGARNVQVPDRLKGESRQIKTICLDSAFYSKQLLSGKQKSNDRTPVINL